MATPSSIIKVGTRALQPLATAVAAGVLYCVTDEGYVVERSTGAAWAQYAPYATNGLNMIINGNFARAQRQAVGTLTTYSDTAARVYGPDRWAITNQNTSVQFVRGTQTVTPEAGLASQFYGKFTKITTTGKLVVSQAMPNNICGALRGRTVRLSLKLKGTAAMTVRVALMQLAAAGTSDVIPGYASHAPSGTFISAFGADTTDPTFGTNLAKIAPVATDNATSANTGLSCAVTTAWQRFGGTFTLPTDYLNLVLVIFSDSQLTATNGFNVSEVQLSDDTLIRQWVDPSLANLNADIFSFYQKSFPLGVAPAQSAGRAGCIVGAVSVAGAVAGQVIGTRLIAPSGSATPLVTLFNPSAANAFVRNIVAGTDSTAAAVANQSDNAMEITFTGIAAWTVGQTVGVHFTLDNEI